MRIHRNLVTPAKPAPFDEDIDFSALDYGRLYPILAINGTHAEGEFYLDEEGNLCVALRVQSTVRVSDSRTLEPFDLDFDYEDGFALLKSPDEDAEGYLFEENTIELSDVVFCSLHTHVPLCPRKDDSALPSSGEGYEVLTEDEVEPLSSNNPFDVLKDFDTESE